METIFVTELQTLKTPKQLLPFYIRIDDPHSILLIKSRIARGSVNSFYLWVLFS